MSGDTKFDCGSGGKQDGLARGERRVAGVGCGVAEVVGANHVRKLEIGEGCDTCRGLNRSGSAEGAVTRGRTNVEV